MPPRSGIFSLFLKHMCNFICSLCLCAVFDHFGYPSPLLGDWHQARWYNLSLTQQLLSEMQAHVPLGHTPLPMVGNLASTAAAAAATLATSQVIDPVNALTVIFSSSASPSCINTGGPPQAVVAPCRTVADKVPRSSAGQVQVQALS